MKNLKHTKIAMAIMALALAGGAMISSTASAAPNQGRNGTTLAAYKTIDICEVTPPSDTDPGMWRYSGEIAVWNEGVVPTENFLINDYIQSKGFTDSGKFSDTYQVTVFDPVLYFIPAGTTQLTALTTTYSVDANALPDSYIRNSAQLTITNHSGQLGKAFGPNPKATYDGRLPPPKCDEGGDEKGCTYTQGYWGSKPNIVWPAPYSRDARFFLATKNGSCISGCYTNTPKDDVFEQLPKSWQEVMDTPVNESQGYYQLAHQYIAAVLNMAKEDHPAQAPVGVQDTLNLALTWLETEDPSACTAANSCGTQKVWAKVLDDFNNGIYPNGPPHCTDE